MNNSIREIQDYDIDYKHNTIYIQSFSDDDGNSSGLDHRVCDRFVKNLDILSSKTPSPNSIKFYLNLEGGDWHNGISMYSRIASLNMATVMYAYRAVSMGIMLLQAAKKRVVFPHSEIMIHYGQVSVDNTHQAAKAFLKQDENNQKVMLDILVDRCVNGPYFKENNFSPKEVKRFIQNRLRKEGDWYLSPEESILYGLADEIRK